MTCLESLSRYMDNTLLKIRCTSPKQNCQHDSILILEFYYPCASRIKNHEICYLLRPFFFKTSLTLRYQTLGASQSPKAAVCSFHNFIVSVVIHQHLC